MAHNIQELDTVLSVRQPTWHGLEEILSEHPTRAEAEAKAHNYQVIREALYRQRIVFKDGEPTVEYYLHEDEQLNVRSDNGLALSTVPTTRHDIQPAEVWDVAEVAMKLENGMVVETAGTFRNGTDMFVLLKLNEPIEIKGDKQGTSLPYIVFQNSYEPGSAFRVQASNVRVVCWNTSRLSDFVAESMHTNWSLAHTLNMQERVDELKDALKGWREGITEWQRAKEYLATLKVNVEQTNWFIDKFIPAPHDSQISERVRRNIEADRNDLIGELFSDRNSGIIGTSLGLFEAASSWNEHVRRAQSPLTRFKRVMLEPSSILADARQLAEDAALV